jgi:hypothetical protein
MAKKIVGMFDRAKADFLPYAHLHKVEQEKDRPYLTDQAMVFLKKKGVVKEEGGETVVTVGDGWKLLGKVGTRAARYIVPLKDAPED